MKVQNTVTLEQAQKLDEAIKGAGLEWPGIEWESGIFGNYAHPYVAQLHDSDRGNSNITPAPNLAELAKMLPDRSHMDRNRMVLYTSEVNVGDFVKKLHAYILSRNPEILNHLKTHWKTLKS